MSKYIIFVGKLVFFAKRELKMHNYGGKSRKTYSAEIELVVIVCSILLSKYEGAISSEQYFFIFLYKETLNEFFRLQGQYTISVAHSSF